MSTCDAIQRWVGIAGRAALGVIFLMSGTEKILGWHMTAGYMAAKGMPFVPLFLVMAIILELGGSLLMISGLWPKLGAAMLILMLVPTTLIFHNFWAAHGPEHQMQMTNFLKNLAIIGGLAVVASANWTRGKSDG